MDCNLKPTKLLDCVLKGVFAVIRWNMVNPDQMHQNTVSNQGLHCLHFAAILKTHQQLIKWGCSNFRVPVVRSTFGNHGLRSVQI